MKDNENNINFDESIKRFIFVNLLNFDKNKAGDENLLKFYSFLIEHKIEKYEKYENFKSIENIKSLINDHNYCMTAFYLIKKLNKDEHKNISDDLLEKIIDSFSIEKKMDIKIFLEFFPDKLNSVIKHFKVNWDYDELLWFLKYIKKLEELDTVTADRIDKYKYYGMIIKYKKNLEEKKNAYFFIEHITKSEEYFYFFFPILERIIRDYNKEKDLNALKLLCTIIERAKNNNFKITGNILYYKYKKEDLLVFNDVFAL